MGSIQTVLCKNPLSPHLFSKLFLLPHHCTVQTLLTSDVSKGSRLFILPQTETLPAQEAGQGTFVKGKCLLYVFNPVSLTMSGHQGKGSPAGLSHLGGAAVHEEV